MKIIVAMSLVLVAGFAVVAQATPQAGSAMQRTLGVLHATTATSAELDRKLSRFLKKPLVLETADRPKFTRQLVRVNWRLGDDIVLFIVRPKAVKRPPVQIFLYGFPQGAETRFLDDTFCANATSNGAAVIGFESQLTGNRYHNVPMKEWFVSKLDMCMDDTVEDVRQIVRYIKSLPDLDATRIGMLGVGSGGSVALMAAAHEPAIRVVQVLNPWGNWPEWIAKCKEVIPADKPKFLTKKYLASVAKFEPTEEVKKLGRTQVTFITVESEKNFPNAVRDKFFANLPKNVTVKRFPTPTEFAKSYSASTFLGVLAKALVSLK